MTPDQARDLQREMKRLRVQLKAWPLDQDGAALLARTLEEVLAHIAAREDARARVPRKK